MSEKWPLVAAHWGTYRAELSDGRAPILHPLETDPDPSPIGQAMIETLDDPCRIGRPMVRRGFLAGETDRSLRGQDSFVALDWDEALDLAAAELVRVRKNHGNEAIYAGSYGWASAGRFHHAQSQLKRFLNLFGGFTGARDTYSYAAAEVILPHILAPMGQLLQEHLSWHDIAERRALVVAFGGIALRNSQVNGGGVANHTQRSDMTAALNAGAEVVTVNPSALDLEDRLRPDWLPIRPNTDVALMLALAHTLVDRGLHARDFLETHCTGAEAFFAYLKGTTDGQPKSARWASQITGIPADRIEELALRMSARPTVVNFSWSLTRQQNGEQAVWMAVALAAILGGIGRPGEGIGFGLGAVNSVGSRRGRFPIAALPTGTNPVETFIPVARIADMLLNPGGAVSYNGQTLTYPEIRLVYWAGGNPFHHHQDLNRLRMAWQRVETVITHEPHWTPLARFSDIVFPATVSLERNDISGSPRDTHLFATSAIAEPFGQSRNDHDILAGLADRITADDGTRHPLRARFTEERDEAQWLAGLYSQTIERMDVGQANLPDYPKFRETGMLVAPLPDRPQRLLEAFRSRPNSNPLPTPSGRIEIFSETIAGFRLDGMPGHPVWQTPQEWLGTQLAGRYPLHLITHQPDRRLHSQLDQSSYSRAGEVAGRAACTMHPDDAAMRGITAGDVIELYNARGRCYAGAVLSPDVSRGVILMATGAWYDPDWSGDPNCCRHGNPNVLTADLPTSALAQGPGALTCLVEARKPSDPVPPVEAFIPPKIIPRP